MGKYTEVDLKWAAKEVIKAEKQGDARSIDLYVTVAGMAGMSPQDARITIYDLAGEIDDSE